MLHSDPTSAITARLEELPFSDPRNNGLALRLRYARSVWRRVQWRWSNSRGSRFSALEGRLEYAALDLPGQRHAFCRRRRVLEVPDAAQVRQLVIQARQPTSTRPPPASQTRTRTAAIALRTQLTIGSFAESAGRGDFFQKVMGQRGATRNYNQPTESSPKSCHMMGLRITVLLSAGGPFGGPP